MATASIDSGAVDISPPVRRVEGTSDRAVSSHPRTIGWVGTTALAMGGSNQSLFIIGALMASQGSAAVPLLIGGLLLSWAATPGWIELVLMWPNRVGGIAASCAEAFRPYSPCEGPVRAGQLGRSCPRSGAHVEG